jgi:hypothetical protein
MEDIMESFLEAVGKAVAAQARANVAGLRGDIKTQAEESNLAEAYATDVGLLAVLD